jgi:hypothetical protein
LLLTALVLVLPMAGSATATSAAPRELLAPGWHIVEFYAHAQPDLRLPVDAYEWWFDQYEVTPAGTRMDSVACPCWIYLDRPTELPTSGAEYAGDFSARPGSWVLLCNPTDTALPVGGADALFVYDSATNRYISASPVPDHRGAWLMPAHAGGWALAGPSSRVNISVRPWPTADRESTAR